MRHFYTLFLALLSLLLGAPASAGMVIGTLTGPDGGWDYARIDASSHRLYVARSASVTVFDLKGGAVRSIGEIAHGHAVIPLPDRKTIVVTSGADATVRFIDVSGGELARVAVDADPDAAVLDDAARTLYTMNAKAGTISAIDVATHSVKATIALKPGLEYAALTSDGTLFVNNEDENDLTAVDTRTGEVSGRIALSGCEGPSGLGYDARTARLIAACANGKAAVVDVRTRSLLKLLDIGDGPDAVLVDEHRRRAYIPAGKSGELDVVMLDGKNGPTVSGRIKTEVGARTGAIDPTDGMVYLPTGRFAPPVAGEKRGAMIKGSFHVLAVRP